MAKPNVTRTYGAIHFEDLDPHRFEDLIRELIYDFKDWQSIEATGRGGSDDGFDIRAYEKAEIGTTEENQNDIEEEHIRPMEGNLWMIQGKREKEIGPKKIKDILADIKPENPPYGYILAASADFTKKSFDVFREELRKKGVMEFYLWGKAALEDMLHLPKNDRILFTFFGISLVSKRKTRTTEVRSAVIIKNKLYRILGERDFHESILVRDIKDTKYPFKKEYSDFENKPRWKEYVAFEHHPLGLCCHNHEFFAYIDRDKKEWDFTLEADLVYRKINDHEQEENEKRTLVTEFWERLPRKNQGHFLVDTLLRYADILLVDEKGDVRYDIPHLYVDFMDRGPFSGGWEYLQINNAEIDLDGYKKIKIFPEKITKEKIKNIIKDKKITLNAEIQKIYKSTYQLDTLYDAEGKYSFLKPKDVIAMDSLPNENGETFIQVTYVFQAKIKDILKDSPDAWKTRTHIQAQLNRQFDENEEIKVIEFRRIYKWQLEGNPKQDEGFLEEPVG